MLGSRSHRGQASTIGGVFLAILMVMLISYVYTIFNYITNYNVESVELLKVANERTREELVITGIKMSNETKLDLIEYKVYGPPEYDYSPSTLSSIKNALSSVDGVAFSATNKDSSNGTGILNIEFNYSLSGIAINGSLSIYLKATAEDVSGSIETTVSIYAFNYRTNTWELLGQSLASNSEYSWYNYTLSKDYLTGGKIKILISTKAHSQSVQYTETTGAIIILGIPWPVIMLVPAPSYVGLNVLIDYMNVNVSYFSGTLPIVNIRNDGISVSRIVDIWLINTTHHIHLPCNVTIPPNSEVEIDLSGLQSAEVNGISKSTSDIRLSPNSRYEIRIITARGNVFTYTFNT